MHTRITVLTLCVRVCVKCLLTSFQVYVTKWTYRLTFRYFFQVFNLQNLIWSFHGYFVVSAESLRFRILLASLVLELLIVIAINRARVSRSRGCGIYPSWKAGWRACYVGSCLATTHTGASAICSQCCCTRRDVQLQLCLYVSAKGRPVSLASHTL